MKKIKVVYILLLLTGIINPILYAQEADLNNIIKKYFETIGQDKLVKIETAIASGVTIQYGDETSFKQIQKKPDKAYLEVLLSDGQILKQGYDGKTGWMQASWMGSSEPVELTGPDLKTIEEMGNIEGDLWNWKEKGHTLKLMGQEEIDSNQVYHLILTKSDGDIDELFIDVNSYILHKMIRKTIINGSEVEVEVHFDDYRNIDGVLLPFTVEQYFNGQLGMTVKIKEAKFDVEVDDNLFTKPD
jgi:outer membrane lipoprotein-sorting protein